MDPFDSLLKCTCIDRNLGIFLLLRLHVPVLQTINLPSSDSAYSHCFSSIKHWTCDIGGGAPLQLRLEAPDKPKLVEALHPILCKGASALLFFLPKLVLSSLCADPASECLVFGVFGRDEAIPMLLPVLH
mmetsp:Transcript_29004/g.84258  ORF Transcript_29004/g.84258 Transcript_29004/m.84258 type:complete len:130 (-) Transcript_29004:1950-2339(-)